MDEWTALAIAARAGDDAARMAFVRATHDEVWRLCAHLGDRGAADDLAQETFLRVFRSLHGYRAESPVRAWLFSIARRVVADDINARQRHRRRFEQRYWAVATPDHAGQVSLELLLEDLDDERRTAFVLTQLLGYPYADAAELCGCPVGTIRSRVSRAREDLVAMLGNHAESGARLSSESA
jgi:RNA polymerase sigma-70 factor (ECF subfamily)